MQTQLNQMPWTQLNELVRQKSVDVEEKTVRMLELQPGFAETQWCYKGHIGFAFLETMINNCGILPLWIDPSSPKADASILPNDRRDGSCSQEKFR